ncbi:hypothetical protein ScPMuIL_008198 [Solemya velum]
MKTNAKVIEDEKLQTTKTTLEEKCYRLEKKQQRSENLKCCDSKDKIKEVETICGQGFMELSYMALVLTVIVGHIFRQLQV